MTRNRDGSRRLGRLLDALEEATLLASDEKILQETRAAKVAATEVRDLVKGQMLLCNDVVPREPAGRRRLLENLLLARPSLASAMRVSFTGSNAATDEEVEEIIESLIRRGLIKNKKG